MSFVYNVAIFSPMFVVVGVGVNGTMKQNALLYFMRITVVLIAFYKVAYEIAAKNFFVFAR